MPRGARGDARRPAPRPTTSSRLRLAGLSGDEVGEFVRRAAGGDVGAGPPELAAGDQRPHRRQRVPRLRAVARAGRDRRRRGRRRRDPAHPPARASSARPESVREVVSQRLSRLAPRTTELLELAATAGPEFELDIDPPGRRARRARAARRPRRGGPQRHDRGASLAARSPTASPTSSCAGRSTTGSRGVRRAELHLRVGEALEARRAALGPRARRPRAPLRRRRAVRRRPSAASSTTSRAARAASRRARLRRGRGAAAHRARARDRGAAPSAPRCCSSSAPPATAPARRSTRWRRSRRRRRSPASSATRELLARGRDRLRGGVLAPGHRRRRARSSCSRRRAAALGDERLGAARRAARRARPRARLPGRPRARRDRPHERGRHGPASSSDRAGLATVLVRSYWSRGTSSLEEILAMLTEARDLAEELGDTEIRAEAMAWRVPTFVAPRRPRAPPGARSPTLLRDWPSRPRSRSCSTWPSTTAPRSRSATAASTRPRRWAQRSHEWSRLLTGRDASGVYGIQMFSIRREQGRLAELAPVDQDPRRRRRPGQGPWRPGLVALLAELGMEAEARRELARVAADGLEPLPRSRSGSASLTYLTDACAALGDEADGGPRLPGARAASRATNVMIGHLVACYGAADRYLGMLAATLGECGARGAHFERALELNRRDGRARPGSPTPPTSTRACCSARGGRRASGPRRCSARRPSLAERIGMPALLGAHRRARRPRRRRRAARRALAARGADPRARRAGPQQPRDRRRRCRSASTPPPTTSAASCARPAAPTAPRPPPTPTATASPRPSRPRYDHRHAALRDRAQLRRAARAHERRRRADRGDQRRRGRPLAVLVPQRRPAAHLLPLRGALPRRDPGRGAPGRRPGRRDRRGRRRPRREFSGRLRDWAAAQAGS